MSNTWPSQWLEQRAGRGCPFCEEGRIEANQYGIRIFAGEVSDAYLQRRAPVRGYTIVVWRGRHLPEPSELSDEEAGAYTREVLRVARALREHFKPVQMNYLTLGNMIPHLHTNVVPRFLDDAAPGGNVGLNGGEMIPDEELERQVTALQQRLR